MPAILVKETKHAIPVKLIITYFLKSCRIAAMCESKTTGTTKQGSHINGKYKIATLGWSKANCCSTDGADRAALTMMLNSNRRQATFHTSKIVFDGVVLLKETIAITGALIPAIISKFRPSKVINSGTIPC